MDTPANVPLALQKAQIAFGLQTLGLLKATRQRWYELGAELLAADVARTESALADLQSVEDWNAFAALLPNAFWQSSQRAMDVLQGCCRPPSRTSRASWRITNASCWNGSRLPSGR